MSWMTNSWVGVVMVLAAQGCTLGSKSLGEDGGAEDSSTSPTASGESAGEESASEVTGTEVTASEVTSANPTGDSGASACEEFVSEFETDPRVEITVRNESGTPVWYNTDPDGCLSTSPALSITGSDGALTYRPNSCGDVQCDRLLEGFCEGNCSDCGDVGDVLLAPDSQSDSGWSGRRVLYLEMDPQCTTAEDCTSACYRADQAPAGTYQVEITAYRTCTGTCECEDEFSPCGIEFDHELSDPITLTATIDYPAETSIEFVIPPA